jgi:mannan endo-1,4-beta-mannosidase
MQDRILNFHGVHNLIWVFNPGVSCNGGSWPPYQTSELPRRKAFYPGDAFCDITGIDLYEYDPAVRGTFSSTGKTYRDAWNMMKAIAPSKMIALCEAEGLPDPAKCFTDPDYAPWLYCLPWFSDTYTDNTSGATRDLCAWNKVQLKSDYVINAGDFVITSANTIPVINKSKINIFPNPVTNGVVTIDNFAQIQDGNVQISIHDLTGRIVQQNSFSPGSEEKSIALHDLKPGVYILECRNGNFRQVEKFVVQQ